MTTVNVQNVVEGYIILRDLKASLDNKHKEKLAPIRKKMDELENILLNHFNEEQIESAKTAKGTAYRTTRTSASITDWDEALGFIQRNELWHMLERRVAKSAIEEYQESTGEPVPGVKVSQEYKVNVRR